MKVVLPIQSKNGKNGYNNAPKIRILLVDTNVSRNTKVMVEKVAKNFKENPQQVQETLEELDRISLSCLKLLSSECDMLSDMESFEIWGKLVETNQQLLFRAFSICLHHTKVKNVLKKTGARTEKAQFLWPFT